jgi:hypothetical protein
LPAFYERVGAYKTELKTPGLTKAEAASRARQVIHSLENRIELLLSGTSEQARNEQDVQRIAWFIRRAKGRVTEVESTGLEIGVLATVVDDLAGLMNTWANDPTGEQMERLKATMSEMAIFGRKGLESPALSIVVDSDVEPEMLADFLAELSSVYSDLSQGDELVIVEGKMPVSEEAYA